MCVLSHTHRVSVWLFAVLWTVACQAPLSMGFSTQEYWNDSPGDLPDSGIESASPISCISRLDSFTSEPPGKPQSEEALREKKKKIQDKMFLVKLHIWQNKHFNIIMLMNNIIMSNIEKSYNLKIFLNMIFFTTKQQIWLLLKFHTLSLVSHLLLFSFSVVFDSLRPHGL